MQNSIWWCTKCCRKSLFCLVGGVFLNFTVVWKLHPAISDWPLNALKLHFQSASEYFDKWCDLKNVMLNNQTPIYKKPIQFVCVF
jgi:hypothetical protein